MFLTILINLLVASSAAKLITVNDDSFGIPEGFTCYPTEDFDVDSGCLGVVAREKPTKEDYVRAVPGGGLELKHAGVEYSFDVHEVDAITFNVELAEDDELQIMLEYLFVLSVQVDDDGSIGTMDHDGTTVHGSRKFVAHIPVSDHGEYHASVTVDLKDGSAEASIELSSAGNIGVVRVSGTGLVRQSRYSFTAAEVMTINDDFSSVPAGAVYYPTDTFAVASGYLIVVELENGTKEDSVSAVKGGGLDLKHAGIEYDFDMGEVDVISFNVELAENSELTIELEYLFVLSVTLDDGVIVTVDQNGSTGAVYGSRMFVAHITDSDHGEYHAYVTVDQKGMSAGGSMADVSIELGAAGNIGDVIVSGTALVRHSSYSYTN